MDEDWVVFTGCVEPVEWGRSTYRVLRLDPGLIAAAERRGTRRVTGTIETLEVDLGINRAEAIGAPFAYVGRDLLARWGAELGEPLRCRLRPQDPSLVSVPAEVASALEAEGLREAFEALTPGTRRRLLQPIAAAKRAETRARRIADLLALLK